MATLRIIRNALTILVGLISIGAGIAFEAKETMVVHSGYCPHRLGCLGYLQRSARFR